MNWTFVKLGHPPVEEFRQKRERRTGKIVSRSPLGLYSKRETLIEGVGEGTGPPGTHEGQNSTPVQLRQNLLTSDGCQLSVFPNRSERKLEREHRSRNRDQSR